VALHTSSPMTAPATAGSGTSTAVVEVNGLNRAFDGRGVLTGVDLRLDRGEFVALLGRSGSGKSTLLRILARLDKDYSGTARVPERSAVAFQDSRLLPWARVRQNVALGLRDKDAKDRVESLLAEVGLTELAGAWPKTLSGGEAQRAALARALVREPELLLMDEPFGALDALTKIKMHRLLRKLCQRYQPTVLLVTHDVDEAVLLADRVLVLTDGTVSLDLPIDLPERGRRQDPGFPALRARLLTELGVADDDQ
jgi:sulfonate transport system ATP-binding protein